MQHDEVKEKLLAVFDEIFKHDGFGNFTVSMKILKKHQKEVIIDCGKQYRYVMDRRVSAADPSFGPKRRMSDEEMKTTQ